MCVRRVTTECGLYCAASNRRMRAHRAEAQRHFCRKKQHVHTHTFCCGECTEVHNDANNEYICVAKECVSLVSPWPSMLAGAAVFTSTMSQNSSAVYIRYNYVVMVYRLCVIMHRAMPRNRIKHTENPVCECEKCAPSAHLLRLLHERHTCFEALGFLWTLHINNHSADRGHYCTSTSK